MSDLTNRLRRIQLVRRPIHVWEVAAVYEAAEVLDAIEKLVDTFPPERENDAGWNDAMHEVWKLLRPNKGEQ